MVTHDQEEAMEMAHRIVVMNRGRIEQVGSADDVYWRPASRFATYRCCTPSSIT
jgi:ABC-type Fe3+/spermidine/putrescine transport system ATPase subunit